MVSDHAARAPEDSVRPQRLVGASARPLDFTVRTSCLTLRHNPPHVRRCRR